VTLGVGLLALVVRCPIGFICSLSLRLASRRPFPMSCPMASRGSSDIYIYGIFCRRRVSRRRHARRRHARRRHARRLFLSVVSYGIPRLISSKDGILCRRCNAYRRGFLRGFVCVMCLPEGHVSLNIIEKIIPKSKIFTETRTQESFRVFDRSSCDLLSETNKFCRLVAVLLVLSFGATLNFLVRTRAQDSSRCCGCCFYNLLFETTNFGLLSCLFFELQKPSSLGIEPGIIFQGSVLSFCNILLEANRSALCSILLLVSCLVSELRVTPSAGIELRTLSPEF
jgi:hypothetical protein